MKMTKEEAIKQIEKLKSYCEYMADSDESGAYLFDLDVQALNLALPALRSITREQVERVWKGEWELDKEQSSRHVEKIYLCARCKNFEAWGETEKTNFCGHCGAPMTDAAVDMVMKKLEVLKVE